MFSVICVALALFARAPETAWGSWPRDIHRGRIQRTVCAPGNTTYIRIVPRSALVALAGGSALPLPGQPRVWVQPGISRPRTREGDLRVDSDLVLITVSVTDSSGRPVTGLDAAMFRLFDAGKEQKVAQFASEDAPISVGIVFDSSASMAAKLEKAKEAVAEFLKASNPDDEFFLVRFNSTAHLVVPFTVNPGDIQDQLLFTNSSGKTALLDAVYLALQCARSARNSHRALLVISDGGENDSRYTQDELVRIIEEADTWIYSIGIYERSGQILPEEESGGPALLTRLAEATGGRQFEVRTPRDLPQVAAKIGLALRSQYVLAFKPPDAARDGKYHRVQVKLVTPGHFHLCAKPGYYAPTQ